MDKWINRIDRMVDGQKNGWMFREKVKPSLGSAKCSKNEFLQFFYFFLFERK